jgi:putative ABC transport system substrate-binding protein
VQREGRRQFLLASGVLLASGRSQAQQQTRVPRIGYLLQNALTEPPSRERQAFLDGLRDYGWIQGRNVELIYKSAEDQSEFIDALARELVAMKPDVIAVSGEPATLAAKRATASIPIVMLALGDPVGSGAVTSIARPGGNITGIAFLSSDLASKRLQLAVECVPAAKRLAMIWNRRNMNSQAEARAVEAGASKLGLVVEPHASTSDTGLVQALGRIATRKPDLLYVSFDAGLAAANRTAIAEFGLRHRIPVVSGWHFLTEAGGLMSYAPEIPAMYRRAAHYVDRILRGARPSDLPIELPTRVDLVVNLRTAKAIGVVVPGSVLQRTDRVIE